MINLDWLLAYVVSSVNDEIWGKFNSLHVQVWEKFGYIIVFGAIFVLEEVSHLSISYRANWTVLSP